jgi:serine/threonine protein phosphatase PrpC
VTRKSETYAATDIGVMRGFNEDGFGSFPDLGFYVVVDGMGAGRSAEEATALVLRVARTAYATAEARGPVALVRALQTAGAAVLQRSRDDRTWLGMGAAVVAVALTPREVHVAHVGDARAYRLRAGVLEQLTEDHSLVNDYRRMKPDLTPDEIEALPKNVITRALGMKDDVEVELRTEAARAADLYLLSSDGLHGVVDAEGMAAILREEVRLPDAVAALIAAANARGGPDNLTALLLRI